MHSSRRFGAASLAVLVLAALAVSHELIYLFAYGAGDGYRLAMSEAGHDGYWTNFILVVALVCGTLLAVAIAQLRRLARLAAASSVGAVRVRDEGLDALGHLLMPIWGRVALLTTLLFLLQENVETASVGHAMPGLGALAGQHDNALPLIVLVSFVVALVRALVRWRRDVLLARLRHAKHPREAARVMRCPAEMQVAPSVDGSRGNGVRAPPMRGALPV